ncbi:hypothetical protein OAO01_06775 [Oligoflexia bacterium]|nr:hypothetical protein [Oligoflexia bacterium]
MKRLQDESGVVYVIAAITIVSIIFFMFIIVKYTSDVRQAHLNYYLATQISQAMQSQTPYKQAALNSGALVAQLAGYTGTQAIETEQDLAPLGKVTLSYDNTVVPHVAFATVQEEMGLLSGFFAALSPGGGISATQTTAGMGATSLSPFLAFFADMSISMLGPWTPPGNIGPFDEYLNRANIPLAAPNTNNVMPHDICHPFGLSSCFEWGFGPEEAFTTAGFNINDRLHTGAVRTCCNWMRSLTIGYLGARAHTFIDATGLSETGYQLPNPMFSQDRTMTTTINGGATTVIDLPWRIYNRDLDYWNLDLGGRNIPAAKQNWQDGLIDFAYPLSCAWTFSFDPGPPIYPPSDDDEQHNYMTTPGYFLYDSDLNAPLVEVVDDISGGTYMVHAPSCSTQTECDALADFDMDPPRAKYENWAHTSGFNISSQHFCVRALDYNLHWYTPEEIAACVAVSPYVGPEAPGGSRCSNQMWFLRVLGGDIIQSFKRVTQSFLIAASEIVPSILFGTFTSPTRYGNVKDLEIPPDGGPPERVTGVTVLFDGNETIPPSHIYSTPIELYDVALRTISRFNDDGAYPNPFDAWAHFGAVVGTYREIEMRAYLDGETYPNLYPEPDLMSPDKGADNYNYWTWRNEQDNEVDPRLGLMPSNAYLGARDWLMPLEHPDRPWGGVNLQGRPGRAVSNAMPVEGYQRHFWWPAMWNIWYLGDFFVPSNKQPRQYFPITDDMQYPPIITGFIFDTSWVNEDIGKRIYDHPPLNEIDIDTGVQDNTTQYEYEEVFDYAPAFYALSGITSGGSDHLGAIQKTIKGCQEHKAVYGAGEPCILSLVTDGAPNLAVDPGATDIAPWTKDPLDFNTLMTKISTAIDDFENLGNTLIMILFIQHPGPVSVDATTFLDLFRCASPPCSWNGNRVLLTFSYNSTDEYRENLMSAINAEIMLIRTQSKLADETNT